MDSSFVLSDSYNLRPGKNIDKKYIPLPIYPPLYATPAQQRPPSPSSSSFSPSPYVLNRKGRSLPSVTQIHHDSSNDRKSVSSDGPLLDRSESQPNRKSFKDEYRDIYQAEMPNGDEDEENIEICDSYGEIGGEFYSRKAIAANRGTVKENHVMNDYEKVSGESLAVKRETKQVRMESSRDNKYQIFNNYGGSLTGYDHGYKRESSSSSMNELETTAKVVEKHIYDCDGGASCESLSTVDEWLQRVSSSSSLISPFSSSSSLAPLQTEEKEQMYNGCGDLHVCDDSLSRRNDDDRQGITMPSLFSEADQQGMREGMYNETCWIVDNLDNGRIQASGQTAEEFYDASEGLIDGYTSEGSSSSKDNGLLVIKPDVESRFAYEVMKRVEAEESLKDLHLKWNQLARIFSSIGYSVPDSHSNMQSQLNIDSLEQFLSGRLFIARVVAASVARATVQVEKDVEFQNILDVKNREIARLHDKMQYYELVNQRMSQRNQEILEATRSRNQRRKDRQKTVIGFLGASLFVGTAGFALYKLLAWKQGISIDPSDLGHSSGEQSRI